MEKEKHAKKEHEKHPKEKESHENDEAKLLGEKISELENALKVMQAEFENGRKRLEREKVEFAKRANSYMAKDLLALVDSMDSAEKGLKEQETVNKEKAIEGIALIKKQLLAILGSYGLECLECKGKKFDPMLHDCIMQGKEEEKDDEIILEELQKGYLLNGQVLRHAKVKVNKK